MQIKQLIQKLQALYETYDDAYKLVMGEPEIVIDVFEEDLNPHNFKYKGWSPDIILEKTSDGVYDIISAFVIPNKKPDTSPWPFPKSSDFVK